jgi:hypothetical protein
MKSRIRRRTPLIGTVVAIVVTAAAGVAAIVDYSSSSAVLAAHDSALAQPSGTAGTGGPQHRTGAASRSGTPAAGEPASSPSRHAAGSTPRTPAPKSSPTPARSHSPATGQTSTTGHRYFRTLPPGAKLPTGAQCARWVRAQPVGEVRRSNRVANHTIGEHVRRGFLAGDGPKAEKLAQRITGDFTGTTEEILRWAACKWGIDQDIVFAQAAVESWWRQGTLGDWYGQASACPPGHGLGADGRPGLCPQSYGILQNRYPYEQQSWPGIGRSTAMNADTAYAIWRSCFDGYETWLNTVQRGSQYHAGDAWGCVGRWFAGRWRTAPADGYIAKVTQYLRERIWTTPDFRAAN